MQAVKEATRFLRQACTLTHVSIYESLHTYDVSLLTRLQEPSKLSEHQVRGPDTQPTVFPQLENRRPLVLAPRSFYAFLLSSTPTC